MHESGRQGRARRIAVGVACTSAVAFFLPAARGDWPVAIKAQHRPGTYWWCPGSAWDEESIDWNLTQLRDGGIGTVHVVPIYGARGYEDRNIPYLSERWVEMLETILTRASALGLQVDMTTGTGWCFGGPMLRDPSLADQVAVYEPGVGIRTRSGMQVKRAAPGGEGPMLDPYSTTAMAHYLAPFTQALRDLSIRPRAQYHDSFEYKGNWTPALTEEFLRRRGYDLSLHLDALFSETTETASRVKYDYRRTLAELHRETIEHWTAWAHQQGMKTRNEAHGAPANLLDVYAASDIAETEMFGSPDVPVPGFRREARWSRPGDTDPRIGMLAASAAHVTKPADAQWVASESCTWMREHWHGTLAQIKVEMDLFFLAGVNHVFYHGSCYSPRDAPWPGFYFYASTKADWRNAIWRDMPILNQYLARCQSILQSGRHGNDVLVYWPIHDLWMAPEGLDQKLAIHDHTWMSGQPIGATSDRLHQAGFAFDFVSDRMLDAMDVAGRALVAPGGRYRAVVIPACRFMPPATLERLAWFAEQGVTVLFEDRLPEDVPGWAELEPRRQRLAAARDRLGPAVLTRDVADGLSRAGISRETIVDHGLRLVRRRIGDASWYFIVNHTATPYQGWTELAAEYVSAVRHDPMTGTSTLLPIRAEAGARRLYLDIQPGEALLVEASPRDRSAPRWTALFPAGDPIALNGNWEVEFVAGGPALPHPYTTASLGSWTDAPDAQARAFAGTARYRTEWNLPDPDAADDWQLDLGDVRESARVRVNGREAGSVVALPFRLRIGRHLKPGRNRFEIEVTNTSANRIREVDRQGNAWRIMHDIDIVNPNYKPFDAAAWPLTPAGLLGPVTLIPCTAQ